MRTSTKATFVIGLALIIGGAFDPLYNGPDVVGMFTIMWSFMKAYIDQL